MFTSVNDTGDKFFANSLTPLNSLSPVSLTPVININLRISQRIFEKIQKGSNGILGGLGDTDSWKKTWSRKSRVRLPLKVKKLTLDDRLWLHVLLICRVDDYMSQRYSESTNLRITDTRSWHSTYPRYVVDSPNRLYGGGDLPYGGRFLIMNISANMKPKSQRPYSLCQGPWPRPIYIQKYRKIGLTAMSFKGIDQSF